MRRWRLLTAAFVLGLGAILVLADRGAMPGLIAALYAFPGGDKVGHFLLMGLLSFLVNHSLGLRRARVGPVSLLLGSLLVSLLVILEELTQLFFQTRTFSLVDLGFSLAGVWLFGWLAGRRSIFNQIHS